MIAGSFNGTTYSIIAQPKFKTFEQLKGAKLAVSSLQAGSTQVLKYILKQRGLLYPRDYALLRAGGTTLRWAAMQTQQVDANDTGGAGEHYRSREGINRTWAMPINSSARLSVGRRGIKRGVGPRKIEI
jgi:ABC-type nitrate/sulfonate/bicarbonate transport system substrate-binding protein